MDIVFVSPEVVPFSKVGGLGDMVGALPKALRALGHKVQVVSLLYGSIDPNSNALARRLTKVQVPLGGETISAEVHEARLPSGVQVTLLSAPGLTDRPGNVYGEADDDRRFAFLSRGAVEWMRAQPKLPDVVHVHDWATALVPVFLSVLAETDPRLASIRTVLTLHDLAHQGIYPRESLAALGLPDRLFSPDALEFYGKCNWLKGGIVYANKLTTLSPAYAKEITQGESGMGLEGVLRARGKDVIGILNGVDFAVWNPATDPHMTSHYDAEDTSAKVRCKADLLARCGLASKPDTALCAWVGRFDRTKGIDLLLGAAPLLLRQDVALVVLGDGAPEFHEPLADLARRFPDRVFVKNGFDDALAHKIYGGADLFLAPSRVEASGLAHLYAMRYGAIPVAHATGGLRDTVLDCDARLETGTGFVFDRAESEDFYGAIARGLSAYQDAPAFAKLRRRVMRRDVSWERSARQYQSLYTALVEPKQPDAKA
ncbi:MAG: glycogen/starch synthase [Deltaproteobacteria bacterium]